MGTRIQFTQINGKGISDGVASWGNIQDHAASYIGYMFIFPMEEGKTYYLNRGKTITGGSLNWSGCQYTTETFEEVGQATVIGTKENGDYRAGGQSIPASMVGKSDVKTGIFVFSLPASSPAPTDVVISEGEPLPYMSTTYMITNNLTNCSNSNSALSVEENTSYFAIISPNNSYVIDSAICTMGETAQIVTANQDGTYSVSIGAVTGDIVITAVASAITPEPTYYTVTNMLTHCTNSNSTTSIEEGTTYTAQISANNGYMLDFVTCTMDEVPQTVTGGTISITSVTGNIIINASASESEGEDTDSNALYNALNKVLPSYATAIKSKITTPSGTNGQIICLDGIGGVYADDAPSGGSSITPEQSALITDIPNKVDKNGIGQVTVKNNIICSNQSKNLVTARYDGKVIGTTIGSWGTITSYDTASNIGYLFTFPMEEGKTYYFNQGSNLNPKWFSCQIFQYTTKNYEEIGRSTIIGTYENANFYNSFGSFPKGNSQVTEYYSVVGKTGVETGVFCVVMPKTQPVPDNVVISENRPIFYEPTELYKVNPDYIKDFDGSFLKNKLIYWFGDSIMHGLYCETPISAKIDALFGSISNNMAVSMKQFYGDGIPSQVTNASAIPPDYIIFNGGANDSNSVLGIEANKSVYNTNPGAMIDNAPNLTYNYGTDTVCGAFETMCQRIRSKYPLAKVFFVSTHYIGGNHPYAEQKAMYAAFKEICHKWAIPVIDITNEGNINSYLDDSFTLNTTGVADKTHPSDKAHYEYFIPMIVRKMAESTIDYNK